MNENKINFIEVKEELAEIKYKTRQFIDLKMKSLEKLKVHLKQDQSIVTEIDLYISNLFKETFLSLYPFLSFYSEEDLGDFKYPLIILDPIDGTRELAQGIGECAVSFGIYYSADFNDKRNFSWIFNPFNSFCVDSLADTQSGSNLVVSPRGKRSPRDELLSFVSQTEFSQGLYNETSQQVETKLTFIPKGSIAYKLALLSSSICDFIITQKPKNIWDIMAGSHICHQKGMKMKVNGKEITALTESLIESPIVWFWEEDEEQLKHLF